jgi:hypothetical protein
MDFIKLGTRYFRDPAVLAANERTGGQAEILFLRALAQCGADESGGYIPRGSLSFLGIPDAEEVAAVLVDEKLWVENGTGWRFRSWDVWQSEHDALVRRRRADRERQARRRAGAQESPEPPPVDCIPDDVSRDNGGNSRDTSREFGGASRDLSRDVTPYARVKRRLREEPLERTPPVTEANARVCAHEGGRMADLIGQISAVRPFWNPVSVAAAARACAAAGRTYEATLAALLAVADDPATIGPGRVTADGPWWRPPSERTARSTTDERVAATLALVEEIEAVQRRGQFRAISGGGTS